MRPFVDVSCLRTLSFRGAQEGYHRALAAHSLDDRVIDNTRRAMRLVTPEAIAAYRARLSAAAAEEGARVAPDARVVLGDARLSLARAPEPGRVKTRLAAEIGPEAPPHRLFNLGNHTPVELMRMIEVLEERVPHGKVFIDGEAEEVPEVVVRDRQHLSEDGFVIVVVAIDSGGRLIRDPEIITRGLVHVDASKDMLDDLRKQLVGMFAESTPDELRNSDLLQEKMRVTLKRYFRKTMGRRPLILPVIWEM